MATPLDITALAAVTRILDKLGVPATLTNRVEGAYDPNTGETAVTETVIAVPKASPPLRYSIPEVNGTTVLRSDYKVIIGRADNITDIGVNDEITINGITGTVIAVDPIWSGEEIAAWILQCRS